MTKSTGATHINPRGEVEREARARALRTFEVLGLFSTASGFMTTAEYLAGDERWAIPTAETQARTGDAGPGFFFLGQMLHGCCTEPFFTRHQRRSPDVNPCYIGACEVVDNGLEPMTFWLPARRSPN